MNRQIGNKAYVSRSWSWGKCLRLKLFSLRMEVDFLYAECERHPTIAKNFLLHAENFCIELDCDVNIFDSEYQMVKA